MNDADIEIVKNCWVKIKSAKGAESFVNNFYQSFFKEHPEIRSLFPDDIGALKIKLLFTLDNIINWLESIETLENELIIIGKRHKALGVKKEMYDFFYKIYSNKRKLINEFYFN